MAEVDLARSGAGVTGGGEGEGRSVRPPLSAILGAGSLPSAPHLLPRLLALTDADGDPGELLALIESDPALTARILRTANSPFFGQARSVTSVQRAVVVLGLAMVRNLTLGLTVWDATAGRLAGEEVSRLWEHSLSVALAAQDLAARSASCNPTDAFTAGILHDAGRLVLAQHFPDVYPLLRETTGEPSVIELERTALDCDHASVGGWLLDTWRVPQSLVEAVLQHHDANPAPGLAALVAAANELVRDADPYEKKGPARDAARARATAAGISDDLWLGVVARYRDFDRLR